MYLELGQLVDGLQKDVHLVPVHLYGVYLLLLLEVVQIHIAHVDLPALLVDAQNEVVRETHVVKALIVIVDVLVLETDISQANDQESGLPLLCVFLRLVDRFGKVASCAG